MPLIELDEVATLLRCPRCRQALLHDGGQYRCPTLACPLKQFPLVGRWPALVDLEHSVIRLADLEERAGPRSVGSPARWTATSAPAWLRRALVKPPNRAAQHNTAQLLAELPRERSLVLVVGGSTEGNGVEAIYEAPGVRVLGLDIYPAELIQVIADAHAIPLADSCVDAVVVQAVLEHVLNPADVVDEIHRVLKPGGLVYAETPFLQQVHAGAYDFTRFTSSGHRYLFRAFEEIAAGPVAGPGTEMLWSIDHLVRGLLRSELAGKLARLCFFWLRYLDKLISERFAMDSASAYYFLGRSTQSPLGPHDIVRYYRGAQQRNV